MIKVRDICFRYAGSPNEVFRDFSIDISMGNIYGLLGKNGTGKSTLLYLLCGLLRASQGTVRIDGMEAKKRPPDLLRDIYIVPEEFGLPRISLSSYVRINREFYPCFSDEIFGQCLDFFELSESQNLGNISMGQKKKAMLSFALAAGTKYLFMDEPTNGLDIPSKSQFRKAVAASMSDERTFIISTHQVKDVENLLDNVIILSESKILLDTSVGKISDDYVFEYRQLSEMTDDVIYAEPALMGNYVVARRMSGTRETPVNLELLFNAVVQGRLNIY